MSKWGTQEAGLPFTYGLLLTEDGVCIGGIDRSRAKHIIALLNSTDTLIEGCRNVYRLVSEIEHMIAAPCDDDEWESDPMRGGDEP